MQYILSIAITLLIVTAYVLSPFLAFGWGKTKTYLKEHRATFVVYFLLRLLVTFTMIRSVYQENYYNAFLCALTLVLFVAPMMIENRLKIELPTLFEIIILCFIFSAEILGEIESYYTKIQGWDTALHTMNGFLCAAVGFSLFDMLNREIKVPIRLSPFYLALMSFCFSMTVGVLWEFGEFGMDLLFLSDAQKDFVITSFGTVFFNEQGLNQVVPVEDIVRTVITTKSGSFTVEGGYLDIGLLDTMKDLLVNFIGAAVFSVLGYFLRKRPEEENLAKRFMIKIHKERG